MNLDLTFSQSCPETEIDALLRAFVGAEFDFQSPDTDALVVPVADTSAPGNGKIVAYVICSIIVEPIVVAGRNDCRNLSALTLIKGECVFRNFSMQWNFAGVQIKCKGGLFTRLVISRIIRDSYAKPELRGLAGLVAKSVFSQPERR